MHTYYEAGLFAQKLALAYDLIASELTRKEKEQIAAAFWKNVITPTVDEYFRFDRMPLAASNWMANSPRTSSCWIRIQTRLRGVLSITL